MTSSNSPPDSARPPGEILAQGPGSYLGVDQDRDALVLVEVIIAGHRGRTRLADAAATGLPASSADIVVGEAVLTVQSPGSKL